jgi:thiamine biosynthesis lipoprotein
LRSSPIPGLAPKWFPKPFFCGLVTRVLSGGVRLIAVWIGVESLVAVSLLADEPQRYVFEKAEMGVPFWITLYAQEEARAKTAAAAAFERVEELNRVFSDYDPDSELSRLCHRETVGDSVPVSRDLWRVLALSRELSVRSGGAFDVTIGPVVNLWRRARRRGELPSADLLKEAMGRVGWNRMHLVEEQQAVRLEVPEMRLDLGGIAKGVAVDAALEVLKKHGIESALVAASGDIGASGAPPGRVGWRVQVTALDAPGAPAPREVWLRDSAVSTAGDTYQRMEVGGVRYSHIVDPRTGMGVTDHSLNTVLGPNCTTTDGLETTLAVLGPDRALELIAATPGTAAYIVRRPSDRVEIYESPRWKELAGPVEKP